MMIVAITIVATIILYQPKAIVVALGTLHKSSFATTIIIFRSEWQTLLLSSQLLSCSGNHLQCCADSHKIIIITVKFLLPCWNPALVCVFQSGGGSAISRIANKNWKHQHYIQTLVLYCMYHTPYIVGYGRLGNQIANTKSVKNPYIEMCHQMQYFTLCIEFKIRCKPVQFVVQEI